MFVGCINRLPVQVGPGNVPYVVSLVTVPGPARVIRIDAEAAGLDRKGQIADLLPGIVVVELAGDIPSGCGKHTAEGVADGSAAAVADMQRPGRVGAHELNLHLATGPWHGVPERLGLQLDLFQDVTPGFCRNKKIDEPGTGDFRRPCQQPVSGSDRFHQHFCNLTWCFAFSFCHLHGDVAGKIAMIGIGRNADHDGRR